jgi:4-amino-4-deoxy-L-arabinose transferase-like glycosyltransferase
MTGKRGPFQTRKIFVVLLFATLCYFPLFLHLDSKPLREWDEARNAINAFEMSQSHQWMVRTFENKPDLWETKPPLLIWIQVLCFKLFGYTELAVRLPSAVASMCLALFLLYYFNRHFKSPAIGIISALVLLTSNGYIHEHAARTGDHDALLVCFEMIMLLSFFMYIEYRKTNQLILFSIGLLLGIYTKSIAALMLLPGIAVYLISTKQFLSSIRNPKLWLAFILPLSGAVLYYISREMIAGGYLQAVWDNELFPRYFNTSSRYRYETEGLWFYYNLLRQVQFNYWFVFLLPFIFINIFTCKGILRRFHTFILFNAVVFLLIISMGTSNIWYDLPLLAFCSMITGIGFYQVGNMLYDHLKIRETAKKCILIVMTCFVLYAPYANIIKKTLNNDDTNPEIQYAYLLKQMEKEYPEIRTFFIYNPSDHNFPVVFYRKVFNATKNYNIHNMFIGDLREDGRYMVVQDYYLKEIQERGIHYDVVFNHGSCYLVKLKGSL